MVKRTLFAIVLLCPIAAHAAEPPCPPKRYLCFEVRMVVAWYGEQAVRDKAKKCGWSDWKIAEAAKCLPK